MSGSVSYFWNWLNVRGHAGIYYVPFNKSVWRIPEEVDLLGAGRAQKEGRPYVDETHVLSRTTPEIFERIMQGGRIREQARRAAELRG